MDVAHDWEKISLPDYQGFFFRTNQSALDILECTKCKCITYRVINTSSGNETFYPVGNVNMPGCYAEQFRLLL